MEVSDHANQVSTARLDLVLASRAHQEPSIVCHRSRFYQKVSLAPQVDIARTKAYQQFKAFAMQGITVLQVRSHQDLQATYALLDTGALRGLLIRYNVQRVLTSLKKIKQGA